VYTFSGYFFGSFPPGKFFATRVAGLVVKHMLIAHERAYKLIKSLPGASCRPECRPTDQALSPPCVLCLGTLARQSPCPENARVSPPAGGADSEVGIVHNEMRFEIFQGDSISRYAPHCRILVPIFDKCWGNEVCMRAPCRLQCSHPLDDTVFPCNHSAGRWAGEC
jgi:hypothetical protein